MEQRINRVHQALAAWKQMEENNVNLFPPSVMASTEFAKFRLKRLDEVAAKLSLTATPDERDSLKILAIERKALLRTAYPKGKGFQRFFTYLTRPLRFAFVQHIELRKQDQRLADIQTQMQKAGFGAYVAQVFKKIRDGENTFSIPTNVVTKQNDQVHFNLKFSFDQQLGHRFDSYQAVYRNQLNPGEVRQHTFQIGDDGLTHVKRAENLISGRAMLDTVTENGKVVQRWTKLDNIQDERGNYLTKYVSVKNFDTNEHCRKLPFWKELNLYDQLRIVGSLISGQRAAVNIERQGKPLSIYIEADPEQSRVKLNDEKGKPIDLKKLYANQKPESVSTLHYQTRQNNSLAPQSSTKAETVRAQYHKVNQASVPQKKRVSKTEKTDATKAASRLTGSKKQAPKNNAVKARKTKSRLSH
ncbi:hypothetical protein [Chitinophaga defluvii]|uniref:DUF3945 domain-containing protein n=1 Tax=Chitinophaga defluvii TaxID=3163343 RepID=A0ABV2TCJ1_9BACT